VDQKDFIKQVIDEHKASEISSKLYKSRGKNRRFGREAEGVPAAEPVVAQEQPRAAQGTESEKGARAAEENGERVDEPDETGDPAADLEQNREPEGARTEEVSILNRYLNSDEEDGDFDPKQIIGEGVDENDLNVVFQSELPTHKICSAVI